MTGKEKILQILANDDEFLLDALERCPQCPYDVGLEQHCQKSCRECWKQTLADNNC